MTFPTSPAPALGDLYTLLGVTRSGIVPRWTCDGVTALTAATQRPNLPVRPGPRGNAQAAVFGEHGYQLV